MQYVLDNASMLIYRLRMLEIILIISVVGAVFIGYYGIKATI